MAWLTGDRSSKANDRISGCTVLFSRRKKSKKCIKLIPKTIGNRKRDCAWGCAWGVNTTWESLDRRAFAATSTGHASSLDSIDFSRSREPDSTLCRRQQACSYTLPQRPPRHIYNPTIARPLPPPALFFEASKQNSPRPRSPSCPPNREALRGGPRFLKLPSNDPLRPHFLFRSWIVRVYFTSSLLSSTFSWRNGKVISYVCLKLGFDPTRSPIFL